MPICRRSCAAMSTGSRPDCPTGPISISCSRTAALPRRRAFRGKDAILSGPAGGVVGMVAASAPHGADRLIGFDMGGTSTDVSHYAGQFELADESVVAGVRIRAPMMQIHTVAAGGGSICRFDGMRFRVGPGKRGRQPRTRLLSQRRTADGDRLQPVSRADRSGAVSRGVRASGDQPLDRDASRARLQEVADQLGGAKSLEEIAEGFLDIAVDNMAAAIRKISIARGHDVTRYTLACFGGAGGQHACRGCRRARHGADPDPSARRRAVGLRDRHCRRKGDPRRELC